MPGGASLTPCIEMLKIFRELQAMIVFLCFVA